MRRLTVLCSLGAILIFFATPTLKSQPILSFTPAITGLTVPVDVVSANDGTSRLFVLEQPGFIKIFDGTMGTSTLPTPFLDLTGVVTFTGDERGLLSIAFHPRYDTNRYFFVYYTTTTGSVTSIHIARYRTMESDPNIADPASGVVLMTIPKPANRTNHNGGKLNFGADKMLYFATGDGGSGGDPNNLAQNGNSLLGKMLRINVDSFYTGAPFYNIPPDNPYVSNPSVLDEIWSLGLRNPFRWSFDRLNNDVWIGDVGQSEREEVNWLPFDQAGGANYGWRCYEGDLPFNTTGCGAPGNYIFPLFDYPRTPTGGTTVTGGIVYRGTDNSTLYGHYIFADYGSDNVWLLRQTPSGWILFLQQGLPGNLVGFAEDDDAEMYAVSINGTVYSIGVSTTLPVTLLNFSARSSSGYNELLWKTATEEDVDRYFVEYSTDGSIYTTAGEVRAANNSNGSNYTYRHNIVQTTKIFYRLRILDLSGEIKYSQVITVDPSSKGSVKIYPTVITGNTFQLRTEVPVNSVTVYSMEGRQVFAQQLNDAQGYFSFELPSLPKGIYQVTVRGKGVDLHQKIVIQ